MNWPDCCAEVAKLKVVESGAVIHKRGDKKPGLTVIAKGQVKIGNYGLDGKYHLTTILSAGDNFGEFTLFTELPRTHDAEAYGTAEIYQLSTAQYQELELRYPQLRARMLCDIATKLHLSLEALDDLRRLPIKVRVAKFLWQRRLVDQDSRITLRQQDIAESLGVTVLAIHKALKHLEQEGLVSLGYGAVVINDVSKFEQYLEQRAQLLPV